MEFTKTFVVSYRNNTGYRPVYHKRTFTITIHTDEFGFYTSSTYKRILEDLTECVRKQENTDKITILWYEVKRS